jgi:hypothetical protein
LILKRDFKKDIDIELLAGNRTSTKSIPLFLKPKVQVLKTTVPNARLKIPKLNLLVPVKNHHFESRKPVVENGTL